MSCINDKVTQQLRIRAFVYVCVKGGGRATPTVDSIVSLVAVCQSSTVENPCIENHGCYINIMKLITELKVISI